MTDAERIEMLEFQLAAAQQARVTAEAQVAHRIACEEQALFYAEAATQARVTAEAELTASLASLAVEMAALREERDRVKETSVLLVRAMSKLTGEDEDTCFDAPYAVASRFDRQRTLAKAHADVNRLAVLVREAQEFAEWLKAEGRYDMHESPQEKKVTDWLARAEEELKDAY